MIKPDLNMNILQTWSDDVHCTNLAVDCRVCEHPQPMLLRGAIGYIKAVAVRTLGSTTHSSL